MITTINNPDENMEILGVVHGDAIVGTNMLNQIRGAWRGLFGGDSEGLRDLIVQARLRAEDKIAKEAEKIGANMVISATYRYEYFSMGHPLVLVTVSGTAVRNKN